MIYLMLSSHWCSANNEHRIKKRRESISNVLFIKSECVYANDRYISKSGNEIFEKYISIENIKIKIKN